MNIFHKTALQGLIKNRTRTLVTILGVILSSALITAVSAFGASLLNFMIQGSIVKYGDWHVEFPDMDSAFLRERIRDIEAVNAASFENVGYAALDGVKSPEKPYLFIAGFGEEALDAFKTLPISLISGRLPENSGEILIPSHIAVKGGVRFAVGDTLTLAVGARQDGEEILNQHDPYRSGEEILVPKEEKNYTVVGIYERPGFEEHSAPGYTIITKADPSAPAAGSSLFVTLRNPRQVRKYADSIALPGSYVLNDYVLRFMGVSGNRLFNTLLYSVGGILVAIIMTGSIFLIYNSFNISLNERTHQFGILLSVGASAKQLRDAVLFEGLCIGMIGIPLGILAGIGSVMLIIPIVSANFSAIINSHVPLTLTVSFPAIAGAAAVSLATILISAYLPARKAASAPVMECIRQTNEIKTEAKTVKTSEFAQRFYGLEGTLALKNFRRNRKRYRSVVLSLTLSVVLFVAGNTFGDTLKQISKAYTVEMDGDIVLDTHNMEEAELFRLYDRLKTADGVYKSTYQAISTYTCTTNDFPGDFPASYREAVGDGSSGQTQTLPLYVQWIEDDIYYRFIESLGLPVDEYTGQGAKVLSVAVNSADHSAYFTNSSMDFTLASSTGEQTKTIRATFQATYPLDFLPFESMPAYLFLVVAPWQMKPQFDALEAPERFGLTFWSEHPAQSMAQIQSMIEEAVLTSDYTLLNLFTVTGLFRSLTFVIDVFTYFFVIMISLIAAANVFNTISTNVRLRRRELAMLRSVGMSEHGFNRMMCYECAFYGTRTLLSGIPIAGLLSWLIYKALMTVERLDRFPYLFPWGSMAISILGVFAIVFVTMLYATGKLKKENIIDALRDDME